MYNFSLEPVLTHRRYLEENIRKEFAGIMDNLSREKQNLRISKRSMDKVLHKLELKKEGKINISEILISFGFIEQLSTNINEQKKRVAGIKQKSEKKRRDLIKALKKRKILEKLKEKRLKEYCQELAKEEQHFLDEVAISRFTRKSSWNSFERK